MIPPGPRLSIGTANRVSVAGRIVRATFCVWSPSPRTGATVRWPLLEHYRTGGVERRLSRGTMRPRRAPTRGAPTVIGDWKFQRSSPTGPGPVKSCEKKAAWERRLSSRRFRSGGEEGDKNVPPPRVPLRSSEIGSFNEETKER